MLQYDDSAFYFFALSILSFYLIPCKLSCSRKKKKTKKRQQRNAANGQMSGRCRVAQSRWV